MKKAIRKNLSTFVAIIGLVAIAAGVGGYILDNQRLRFPWEPTPFELKAAFSTAQAVTPGQGQTLRVSGVRIGDISKVELEDGRAIVTFGVDPKYAGWVKTDATALLRPKTGLKDMFVELDPGSDSAPAVDEGFMLPVQNTLPDVNPDEILGALDADTRDYLSLLVNGAGRGLEKRGNDLQEVFARFEPTHRDLAKVTGEVAKRRANLRRLITSLNGLNRELAGKDDELAELVDSSSKVFAAFASERQNISRAVDALPGALRQTTETLGKVEKLGNVLGPAATDLRPAFRALNRANKAVRPFVKEAAPILRDEIRPFARDARPVVRALKPSVRDLATATPQLTRSFKVLNSLFNLIGYNERGREGPTDPKRDEGYLFWIAWLQHNAGSVFGTSDANGPMRPITVTGACPTLRQVAQSNPPLDMVLSPALMDPKACGI